MNAAGTFEHKLIRVAADLSGGGFIGDDCAVLPGGLLVTSDTLVEGRHFLLPAMPLPDLGWKAAAVSISDIAAMAGSPRYLLVNLSMPDDFGEAAFRQLYGGLIECARTFNTQIVGGDLTGSPLLCLTTTVLGEADAHGVLRRDAARPGDVVVTTGDFGASAAGLWLMTHGKPESSGHCLAAHVRPYPRLEEAKALAAAAGERAALIDASDGLADALLQIAAASCCAIEIEPSLVPLHAETVKAAASAGIDPLSWAYYGGEDYELVATVPASVWSSWERVSGNPFKAIGTVTESKEPLVLAGRTALEFSKTFQHWRSTGG